MLHRNITTQGQRTLFFVGVVAMALSVVLLIVMGFIGNDDFNSKAKYIADALFYGGIITAAVAVLWSVLRKEKGKD